MSLSGIFEQDINHYLVLVQPRKTSPDMTEKNVDWDVKNQTTILIYRMSIGQVKRIFGA